MACQVSWFFRAAATGCRAALPILLFTLFLPPEPCRAGDEPPPSPTPGAAGSPATGPAAGQDTAPGALRAGAPAEEPDNSGLLPRFNLYLPDGRADIRLLKPIRNSLFEMQVAYNFVSGDISAFLRYKYYGRTDTSTFTFFDTIEFSDLSRFSNEFTRTRGGLYLLRVPLDFYNRIYGLAEFDRLTFSNPLEEPDANRTNVYLKTGYQYGTPSDERSNAIVGEARDRVFNLFTALREIGPHGRGFSGAATWGVGRLGGDYSYVKTEFEALQAISVGPDRLVLRLHGGYFPFRRRVREVSDPAIGTAFSIPRYELFALDSREALRGYRGRERGTNEAHLTAEYAVPFFRDTRKNLVGLDWESLYAVGYAGTGNVGDGTRVYGAFADYKVDVGAGIESSLSYRRTQVFLSALAAKTVVRGVGGVRFLLSVRSYR